VLDRLLEKLSRKTRKRLSNFLILSGIIVIVFPLATEAYGYYKSLELMKAWDSQAESQKAEAEKIREDQDRLVASGKLPDEEAVISGSSPGKPSSGKQALEKRAPFPKTKVIIPKIEVNQVILEGTSSDILKLGPGHYIGMANPGEKGNVGIAGHRVTYTHPFNRLDELNKGDVIILETVDYVYEYHVDNIVVVDPKDVSTLQPTSDAKITLTTCNPKYSAKTRLNVQGVLVDTRPQQASIIKTVKEIFKDHDKDKQPENRAKTYEELLRDLDKAQKAAKKNPLSANSYIELSKAYLALEYYSEAIKALRRGELIEPKSAEILKLYMVIDEKKKRLQEEITTAEKNLVGQRAISPMVYVELGYIHMAQDEYEQAALVFDKGIQASPYAADMYFYKAMAYEEMGRDDLALATYNEALIYDPTYQEALNAIERIKNKKPDDTPGLSDLPYRLRPQ